MDPALLTTISSAFAIVIKSPKVLDALKQLGISAKKFLGLKGDVPIPPGPLRKTIDGLRKKLDKLVEKHEQLADDDRYGELEKDERRKQIAKQVCALLKSMSPVKADVSGYDTLVELWCQTIPDSL